MVYKNIALSHYIITIVQCAKHFCSQKFHVRYVYMQEKFMFVFKECMSGCNPSHYFTYLYYTCTHKRLNIAIKLYFVQC